MKLNDQGFLRPVPSPRFVSPRNRIPYHDLRVQALVNTAFKSLLPQVRQTGPDTIEYFYDSPSTTAALLNSKPADLSVHGETIALALHQGWEKLKLSLKRFELPEGVRALILNFRLPDPLRDAQRYRILSGEGEPRFAVCWAFEDEARPFVTIERALSLLGTELSDLDPIDQSPEVQEEKTGGRKLLWAGGGIAALLLAGWMGMIWQSGKEKPSDKEELAAGAQEPGPVKEPAPEPAPAPAPLPRR